MPISASAIGQALGDGHFRRPSCSGTMAKVLGRDLGAAAAIGVLQPLHQHLHQIHHHPGMAGDQRLEAVRD